MRASFPLKKAFGICVVVCASFASASLAQTATTDPVGFNTIKCLGSSDTLVSLPFIRPPVFAGAVTSASGSVLTFSGTPFSSATYGYADGAQPVNYALVSSGTKEGSFYTIKSNTATTLTVEQAGSDFAAAGAALNVQIVPFWTLGTVFPGGAGVNTSPTPASRSTEILFPAYTGTGIDLAPNRFFYYWNGNWREVGSGTAVKADIVLYPDQYFIVRNNVAVDTTLVPAAQVLMKKFVVPLATSATGSQDNFVAIPRPIPVSLTGSNLFESGAFLSSPTPANRVDELYVYDNATAFLNKAPSSVYYYWNSHWRKVGAGAANLDTELVFTPGTGVLLRKGMTAGGLTSMWVNTPTYAP